MAKRFPDNPHMNNFADWIYLGSDRKNDYYYKDNSDGAILGSDHLMAIVYGNEPWEYLSPSFGYFSPHSPEHKQMQKLLAEHGIVGAISNA